MELTGTLLTGYGFWNPVFLILAGLVTSLVAYLLWRRGGINISKRE